jgi:predicted nuclease with TOPRIM domain
MTTEEIALKLQETTDRSVRNEGRIKKLEGEHEVLQNLATSVAVMAEQIKTMNGSVTNLTDKVDKLEEKPGKRWESIVDKVLWAVLAAVIAYLLGSIGL